MLKIKNYVRVQSLEEAYDLCQKKNNVVLGGMLWLKMQRRSIGTAIDLSDLGLNQIEEDGEFYRLGAMVSLRTMERHHGLNELTQGAMKESLRHIVGVQFRNLATVGGSLWGRFGFSDVLTLLLALDAQVELHHAGRMSLEEFTQLPRQQHDILTHVLIPKGARQVVYQSQRNISTDFPTLTCALSKKDGEYTCVIGARPQMAQVYRDEKGLLSGGVTEETAGPLARTWPSGPSLAAACGRGRTTAGRFALCWCAVACWPWRRRANMELKLTLNGRAVSASVEADTLLIDFLRAQGCLSVKRGCETANCGLCTVLMDGTPVLSCSVLALRAAGHHVQTLEGLQEEAADFAAFIADQGAEQCGFCNPGFVMNTVALLRENPDPTDDEIRAYLAGNLCRCSGYEGQLRGIRAYLDHKKGRG